MKYMGKVFIVIVCLLAACSNPAVVKNNPKDTVESSQTVHANKPVSSGFSTPVRQQGSADTSRNK
jgi:hypothetical protein